jgi:hypothetical protein
VGCQTRRSWVQAGTMFVLALTQHLSPLVPSEFLTHPLRGGKYIREARSQVHLRPAINSVAYCTVRHRAHLRKSTTWAGERLFFLQSRQLMPFKCVFSYSSLRLRWEVLVEYSTTFYTMCALETNVIRDDPVILLCALTQTRRGESVHRPTALKK